MLADGPIVVSVPAREIAAYPIPCSVFGVERLWAAPISPELRLALELVVAACSAEPNYPLRCVARPEVFTHGASLDWLTRRLDGATDHICLSDGTSLKLIPGLRNHMFTFGLQSHHRLNDFKKLMRRAPELIEQFRSQVNSFHRTTGNRISSEPTPKLLSLESPLIVGANWFFEFYLNPHSLTDSAERMLGWGELHVPPIARFDSVTFIPLTECAINDLQFQRHVGALIAATYFDQTSCLFIQLPAGPAELTERMCATLEGLRAGATRLPQFRAKNIFFVSEQLPEVILAEIGSRLAVVLHETFDYWRYTRAVYIQAKSIDVFLDCDRDSVSDAARTLLVDAFGQPPRFVLPSRRVDVDGFPA